MTLQEMAGQYRQQEEVLGRRIAELNQELAQWSREDPRWGARAARLRMLKQMHRENRELAVLLERYYDRGYRPNEAYTL